MSTSYIPEVEPVFEEMTKVCNRFEELITLFDKLLDNAYLKHFV